MHIGPLTHDDIPAALRLSTQAGWNQLDADWRRLLDLWPGLCLAGRVDGDVIATTTLARFGGVAWVGMVLVDEAHRGKGYGGAIMDAALSLAGEAGIEVLALDATDAGRPVYLKRGFADAAPIARWIRQPGPMQEPSSAARELAGDEWPKLLALDRQVTGIDRSRLLEHLRRESGVVCRVVGWENELHAFGFRRRGRTADHIGPVVGRMFADDVWKSLATTAARDVIIDVLNIDEQVLYRRGFTPVRYLKRMYRGPAPMPEPENLAAAGFELG